MDLWYAHQKSVVMCLTQLPPGVKDRPSYHDSGWPTYEHTAASLIKQHHFEGPSTWRLMLDLGGIRHAVAPTCFPITGHDKRALPRN